MLKYIPKLINCQYLSCTWPETREQVESRSQERKGDQQQETVQRQRHAERRHDNREQVNGGRPGQDRDRCGDDRELQQDLPEIEIRILRATDVAFLLERLRLFEDLLLLLRVSRLVGRRGLPHSFVRNPGIRLHHRATLGQDRLDRLATLPGERLLDRLRLIVRPLVAGHLLVQHHFLRRVVPAERRDRQQDGVKRRRQRDALREPFPRRLLELLQVRKFHFWHRCSIPPFFASQTTVAARKRSHPGIEIEEDQEDTGDIHRPPCPRDRFRQILALSRHQA